ncbi:helix-turn-helix transcriptional regulator [Nocardia cyriacigeorgica]|uniref:helix-turn-helix domain-containing protein n=1 Tax=Nocardia cyriacigeorgica TaxID=135487 RepID=UPI0013BB9EC5|nr:helix-turn-helix domain-containing protein [Nocardia cyriacigeorgica]NEW49391.1 helix-turn-helix transcriptional regulator [Nocardia cyriacigeorgica]
MDRGALNAAFGEELLVRRRLAGLRQESMWSLLLWKRNTYKRTEGGLREPYLADLIEVALVLDTTPRELFDAVLNRLEEGNFHRPTSSDEWRGILGMD